MSIRIKVSKLSPTELFLPAFKALCNLPVKSPKSNWELALTHAELRSKGKTREEAVQSALEASGESLDGRTFTFKTNDARKAFAEIVKGIDAQEFELPIKTKVKLTVEEFGKLNPEQIGELLDIIEPPSEATA